MTVTAHLHLLEAALYTRLARWAVGRSLKITARYEAAPDDPTPTPTQRPASFTLGDRWLAVTEGLAVNILLRAHHGEQPDNLMLELVANAVTDRAE